VRGRPSDPTKIKLGETRSRSPAKAQAKAVSKALAKAAGVIAQVDAAKPDKPLVDSNRQPIYGRGITEGSVFLRALDLSPHVTPAQRLVIEQIGKTGFTAQTATEFWAFQLIEVQRLQAAGELTGREYTTALAQLGTSAGKLAELAVRANESTGPSAVNFQLNIAGALAGPAYISPLPGPNGDAIEVG